MLTVVSPEKLYLSAGTVLRSPATWQDYQALQQQRGDASLPRLKYRLFPGWPVSEGVRRCFAIASERNTSAAIRDLRQCLTDKKSTLV
nr:hypothetical protein [Spirulina major]